MIPQYKPIYTKEEKEALKAYIDTPNIWFSEFNKTEDFEKCIEVVTKNDYCSVVNNGTIAISLALLACGVQAGHEVIVPELSMIATANAVRLIGAKVVFADTDNRLCLDANKAISLVTDKTKAIIYVTLNGRMNLESIKKLRAYCLEHRIYLIKDDAQSLGSFSKEFLPLQNEAYGDIHTLSFSPHKVVSCGQGGAIVTNNAYLAEKVERLKDFGRLSGGEDNHPYFGINSKFTDLQAVLGIEQIKNLEDKTYTKQWIYDLYFNNFFNNEFVYMSFPSEYYVPWFVDIYVPQLQREDLIKYLLKEGIQTRKMYPIMSSQEPYMTETGANLNTLAFVISTQGLWLPSSFDLQEEEITFVCDKIKQFFKENN